VTRLRTITIGAALVLALILAVLAYLLAESQSQDREEARNRFDDVAKVSSSVTNGIFQLSLTGTQQQVAARFGAPRVDATALAQFADQSRLAYAAVLDARGRPLGKTGSPPAEFGPATETALKTGKARLSDYMELNGKGVIEWAIPYDSAAGHRIYVSGSPASAFEDFLERSLGDLPNFADPETVMVDGEGVVLGGVKLSADVGHKLPDSDLVEAIDERGSGTYGDDGYFAAGGIEGSPFRIVLDTTEDELYEEIDTTLAWVIFAAFALTALAGLLLLRRMLSSAAELERRELNERHAVEINDNIIQGLALAKYQLQRGEDEASSAQLAETLREAQRLVSGLLGDAEVQAGQLRREVAAETSRPEPPAAGPDA
jgi:hypothetical protein